MITFIFLTTSETTCMTSLALTLDPLVVVGVSDTTSGILSSTTSLGVSTTIGSGLGVGSTDGMTSVGIGASASGWGIVSVVGVGPVLTILSSFFLGVNQPS